MTLAACNGAVALGGPKDADPASTETADDGLGAVPLGMLKAASKIDLLLAIDNSSSMSDKQQLLKKSVPDLLMRLVSPRCIGPSGAVIGAWANGACAAGRPEFAPVRDLHIGIVSSSLGGPICDSAQAPHLDDAAHLLSRGADGQPVPDAAPGFLTFGAGGITDPEQLRTDLANLVSGVGDDGCGIEHQLESWYRFLVQPDPYESIGREPDGSRAQLDGVDATILRQRHDFLRPDSLLAIVMLTDEEDASVDPMKIHGLGYAFMDWQFPGSTSFRDDGRSSTAPRASSACDTSPASPDCTSCAFGNTCNPDDPGCQALKNDPSCQNNNGYYGATEDDLNVRFYHMKQRYGVDPQFPITRYVRGLSSAKVPSRNGEHDPLPPISSLPVEPGPYVPYTDDYRGREDCDNPLFSMDLPTDPGADLCHLKPGPRSRDLVVFSVITGVPASLLTAPVLSDSEWERILGRDPLRFDYTGIDPHMIQSTSPRAGLPGVTAANDADPIHGREWDTGGKDLQFACTFPLETPIDCSAGGDGCDCARSVNSPPLCGTGAESKHQLRAKAYPGVRQLEVARALGERAVVSSLCPVHVGEAAPGDPLFAYRPAMLRLGDRMSRSLVPLE
jgi:hypothetical protein